MNVRKLVGAALAGGLAAFSAQAEKISLFNGRDLAGWVSVLDHDVLGPYAAAEPTWFVKDGAIFTTGTPFGYLRTKRADFANYRLHVEYRWWRETPKPNSGVFVRLVAEHAAFAPTCLENQLCRGKDGDVLGLAGMKIEGRAAADAYDPAKPLSGITTCKRAGASAEKPFGEWNAVDVELVGDTLVNRVNGVELNRVAGIAAKRGAIALQSEGGCVQFRNVWIEPLP